MAKALMSPEAVIAAIRARHSEKLTLTWILVNREVPILTKSAEEHFTTWGKAILDAGFTLKVTRSEQIK
jgi:hypothetical protein